MVFRVVKYENVNEKVIKWKRKIKNDLNLSIHDENTSSDAL